MSAITMTPARSRSSVFRWVAGALGLATLITVVTIAVWPASAADKAREDGKHLGQAVGSLYEAQSQADVEAAFDDMRSALDDTRQHAGDELNKQVDKQADALNRAADGFVGAHSSDNSWDQDLYQSELDYAVDDLANNAGDFQNQHSEVANAYWDGFQDGLPADLQQQ
jgi:acyl-CoA reductase-like NAD-dependent aldehyde dehydrogenase